MKYFTSDWHLGHKNMIEKFNTRPFSSIEENDDTIIHNAFSIMKDDDILYFLGDLYWELDSFWKMHNQKPKDIQMIWILGNHDQKQYTQHINHFDEITQMKEVKIGKHPVTLCHYPMMSWNKSHYNAWQLFGHHHIGTHNFTNLGKQLNVNVEFHNYKPWSEEEIKEYMNHQPDNPGFIGGKT